MQEHLTETEPQAIAAGLPEEPSQDVAVPPELDPRIMTIRSERVQQIFDQRTISETLDTLRTQFAVGKVQYLLAVKGIGPEDKHPNQLLKAVKKIRAQIDYLKELADESDTAEEGIAWGGGLELPVMDSEGPRFHKAVPEF